MIESTSLVSYVTFIFGLAAFSYIIGWIFKSRTANLLGTAAMILATAGIGSAFVLRWMETYWVGYGHVPLASLYESLVFFTLTLGVIYLFIEYKYKNRIIGIFAALAAFLALAYASLPSVGSQIQPLMPALQSNWLIVHVMTYFLGYAALTLAFCASLLYLLKSTGKAPESGFLGHIPGFRTLDDLTYQLVIFGFLFITLGLITGAVWAEQAWGRYWGWDPKETWSLITWFVYATLLHARLMRGWEGKRLAYLSVIGFASVLFTYFGVNLLPGLHSYL
jgi:cytochrome c-type biogenesis protein CcsB